MDYEVMNWMQWYIKGKVINYGKIKKEYIKNKERRGRKSFKYKIDVEKERGREGGGVDLCDKEIKNSEEENIRLDWKLKAVL